MAPDNTVEFETVKRRFDEADDALNELKERLQGLAGAAGTQEQASTAISDASSSLREASTKVAELCDPLRSAMERTMESLQRVEDMVTGAALTAIRTGVDTAKDKIGKLAEQSETQDDKLGELASGQETIREQVNGIQTRIDGELSESRQALDSTRSELEAAQELITAAKAVVDGLPNRHRSKFDDLDL